MTARPLTAPIPVISPKPPGQAQDLHVPVCAAGGVAAAGQPARGAGRVVREPVPAAVTIRSSAADLRVDRVDQPHVHRDLVAWMSRNRPSGSASWRGCPEPVVARAPPARPGSVPRRPGHREPAAGPNKVEITTEIFSRRPPGSSPPGPGAGLVLGQPARVRVSAQVPHGCGRTNERRSIPRSFSLHSHTQSACRSCPAGQVLDVAGLTSHTSSPAASASSTRYASSRSWIPVRAAGALARSGPSAPSPR